MAIKNKNIMFNLVENLNENKMNEIQKFKKSNLKEANVDNIEYVTYLIDTAESFDDIQQAVYEIDDGVLENEVQQMLDSCSEKEDLEEVKSLVLSTMEDNAEYDDIDESSSNKSYGDKIRNAFDKENEVYNLQFNGNDETQFNANSPDELIELWIDFCKEEKIDPSCLDNVEFGVEECDKQMNEDVPMDEPSPEDFEEDRKNTLIAKKDELETRLGDILQSIKDKQMDTEEFRKLSREAAELDSQIMDIDNQIRGVYECDKSGKLTEEDSLPDITYLLEDYEWKIDVVTKENLGSDYSYFTLVKTPEDALRFNYHSDYWGTADAYQAMAEEVVNAFAPFVDKNVVISFDDGDVKAKVLGILIDRQYNDLEHMKLLIEDLGEVNESINESELFDMSVYSDLEDVNVDDLKRLQDYAVKKTKELVNHIVYWAPYSGIAENILRDMINIINESLPNISESVDEPIDESDEDVKKGIVDQLVATGMTKEQAEQTANGICNIFKNKVGSNQVVSESVKPITEASITEKNLLKSQGNVYMFECKGNPKFTHIVGENYDESENTLENVETYNNKEDADKDYLGRCDITTESQKTRDIGDGLDESDESDESNKNRLLSVLISHYPDISQEDEDFLYTLSYEELKDEILNRGISLEDLDESVVASGLAKDGGKYKKIDLYVDGKYYASTNSYKTVKDAVNSLKNKKGFEGKSIKGNFSK